jgi:hypothetical protein
MKNTIKILTIFILVTSLSSCKKIEELADVTFDTTLTDKIEVSIDQTTGTPVAFNMVQAISLDNSDTHDYLSKVKDISINSLSYKIIDFSGDSTGTIDVEFFVDNVSLLADNITVKTEADTGHVFEVTNTTQLSQIASALKSGQSITAKYQGTALCDADNMDFKIEVTIGVRVTANPL